MAHFTLSEEHAKQIADALLKYGHVDFVFQCKGGTLLGVFMSKGRQHIRHAAKPGEAPKVDELSHHYMLGIRYPYGMMVAEHMAADPRYLGSNKKPPAEDVEAVCAFAKMVISHADKGPSAAVDPITI